MAGALGGFMAGSIFAKLVLDKTGWDASVQSVEKDKKTFSDVAGKIGKSFEDVGKKLTVVGGAIVASFGAMITKTANYGDMINDMSARTGIATEILSGYKLAADKSGTSIEGFAIGMKGLSRVMFEAASGGKEAKDVFAAIGISATDSVGKVRPLDQVMLDVADRFANMANGAAKNALAMKLFGKAGMDLIPMLNMGSEGLKKNYEEAERLGMVFSKTAAMACDEFNDQLAALKGGLAGTRNELAMQLMPMVTDFVIKMKEVIIRVREWMNAHPELVKWIGGTTLKLGALFAVLGPLLIIISKLITASIAMGAGFASALGPITLLTAAAIATHKVISDLIKAKEELAEKDYIAFESNEKLAQKLREVTDAAGLTRAEFHQLALKYDENYAAMAMAIKKGKEGVELQETLTKVGKEHGAAIDEEIKKINSKKESFDGLAGGIITVRDAEKEYTVFLESAGIKMYDPARIADLLGWQKRLADEFKSGKIDAENYAKGMAKVNAELWEYGGLVKTAIPPARDLSNALKLAPGAFQDLTYAIKTDTQILDEWAVELGLTRPRVAAAVYEINRLQLALMGIYMPEIDFGLPVEDFVETTRSAMQEVSTIVSDAMRNVGRAIVDAFGISEALAYKMTKFNDAYYEQSRKDIDADYEYRRDKLSEEYEGIYKTKRREYEDARDLINDSTMDEAAKREALKKLERDYEDWVDLAKKQEKENLLAIEKQHQLDLDKIRKDEDTARQKHADDEEKRQNSLWNKVKGIFGTALEEMLTMYISDFLMGLVTPSEKAGDAITKTLGGAIDTIGTSITTLATSIGTVITELAAAVGTGITSIATGIASAMVIIAEGIAESAKTLAAAAEDIIIVAAIALGIYSAFRQLKTFWDAVSSALEGAVKKEDSNTAWLKRIWENTQDLANWIGSEIKPMLHEIMVATWDFMGLVGHIYDLTADNLDHLGDRLVDGLGKIKDAIENLELGGAQHGAVITKTGLIKVHGTPSRPEIIAPLPDFGRFISGQRPDSQAVTREINIKNEVHIDGMLITDREYTRTRLMPEIIEALSSNLLKSKIQQALGV